MLRRIRRAADLSQRELAAALGISQSAVAQGENGRRDFPAGVLVRAAALAGLRLALLDEDGNEVTPMADEAVRDTGYRRFPAHLDTRYSDERWWHGPERYSRPQPWYTFDRDRAGRDAARRVTGTPDDHQLPQPGDSPQARRARRRQAALRQAAEERQRRFLAGELARLPDWACECPPECAHLDQGTRPVHAPNCACGCDID
jgi:transcriptional regulator with XRE-family HTH domain